FPRPPPEPPDVEFDFEPDSGEEISVVMNTIDELECLDPRDEVDVSTNDDDHFPFMLVIRIFLPYLIYSKVFSFLLSVESEDTIFDTESDNSLSDNFSPEFKTFCNHTEETRSGSTITHVHDSLPEYDSFCFEIEPDQE
nr:hypothetical protein [Tanacetum cinerariifolium]